MNFLDILEQLAQGLGHTLLVTLTCSATALLVGLVMAGLRQLGTQRIGWVLDVLTYVFRGIPVLVLLFMVYFGLPSIGLKVSPLTAMALSLGLIAAAYLSEVFRGALQAVSASEILAAQASGMSRLQIFRYIEAPQMLRFDTQVFSFRLYRRYPRDDQAGHEPHGDHASRDRGLFGSRGAVFWNLLDPNPWRAAN